MPKKGENIYKRKDGRWEGRYIKTRTYNGKIMYGYVYAKTYREVKAKLQTKLRSNTSLAYTVISTESNQFSVVALEWFQRIKTQTKESTANKYHNMLLLYILPSLGEKKIDNMTYDCLETYCNHLLLYGGKKQSGLSPKTVTDIMSVIRSILRFAIRKGIHVPCDGSTVQIKQYSKPMRVLSSHEQVTLCRYLLKDAEFCNLGILICLFTGLRVGEICALRWEDISLTEQTIYIRHTLQRIQNKSGDGPKTKVIITSPKSTCSTRIIPISDELGEILATYKSEDSGFVLTNSDTVFVEPRTMQNHFKSALKMCNLEDANFHALRHTFATRCVEAGFDIKSLSEILGHATVNITMNRYVHPTLELKKENMKKLSHLLAVK